MTTVLINPGSGPVDDATEAQARTNMQEFLAAIGLGDGVAAEMQGPSIDWNGTPDGRWTFTVSLGTRSCEVEMPGVSGLAEAAASARMHPRLYVDGGSWFWDFGLRIARECLTTDQEGRE
jgi:hypothetical protein